MKRIRETFCQLWMGILDNAMIERRVKREIGRQSHISTDRITKTLEGRGSTMTLVRILVNLTWQLERDEFDETVKLLADKLWEFTMTHRDAFNRNEILCWN